MGAMRNAKHAGDDKSVLVPFGDGGDSSNTLASISEPGRTRVLEGEGGVTHLRYRVRR